MLGLSFVELNIKITLGPAYNEKKKVLIVVGECS